MVKDRNQARETAPASGLYLKEVYYGQQAQEIVANAHLQNRGLRSKIDPQIK